MSENEITYQIRGAIFDVYNKLGPDLLEKIYEKAIIHELEKRKLKVQSQVPVPIIYDDIYIYITI